MIEREGCFENNIPIDQTVNFLQKSGPTKLIQYFDSYLVTRLSG